MNLFYQPLIQQGIYALDAIESKHCTKVLRQRTGDIIHITDGKGFLYHAVITKADVERCVFDIRDTIEQPLRPYSIHIAISPTKHADRIEWFVEKSVEIGVDSITLIDCEHTERSHQKFERLEKIAVSAMKQSLRLTLPTLKGPVPAEDIIRSSVETSKFIAYVDQENPHHLKNLAEAGSSYLVLIGPEGDFSKEELTLAMDHQFQKVSLGSSRLRTETAGLAACHILNLVNTP